MTLATHAPSLPMPQRTLPFNTAAAPQPLGLAVPTMEGAPAIECVVCHRPIDFAAGEAAVVLKHVAYGYDFSHDGACLQAARELLFPEPGYDGAAFGWDPERRRVLASFPRGGWAAVVAETNRHFAPGAIRIEPLFSWLLVEHADGSRTVEGLVRDAEWLEEPGGAQFPEAASGSRWLGYASPEELADPARLVYWETEAWHQRGAFQRQAA